MKKILASIVVLLITASAFAQKTDTVIVELAKTSRMVFTIKDKSDLQQLKQYDFQALFDDILKKLENNQRVVVVIDSIKTTPAADTISTWAREDVVTLDNPFDSGEKEAEPKRIRYRSTRHSFDIDLGFNSFLEDGKFPDEEGQPYAVRPWGSWNVGLNSVLKTGIGRNFHMQWSVGVSWHDFKFQNDRTVVVKGEDGLSFEENLRDVNYIKSKLGLVYLNAAAIPMFTIGGKTSGKRWRNYTSGFRIGAGPYAGYRIGSNTKQVIEEDGDRERNRTRDNFYLSNVRYGVRMQVGIRSADFFFAYDLNDLFAAGKGPKLNAFSFGITL